MPYEYYAQVHEVHDGDTATLSISLGFNVRFGPVPFRFYGINTPEMNSPDPEIKRRAEAAKQFVLECLKPGLAGCPRVKVTTFKADPNNALDKFGRGLAQISYEVIPAAPPKVKGKKQEPTPPPYWVDLCDQLVKAGHAKPYFGEGEKPV